MVYTVYMQRLDPYSHGLFFRVLDSNDALVAELKKDEKSKTHLYYDDSTYEFPFAIKTISTPKYSFKYPISSSSGKRLGYQIIKNGSVIAEYYGESAIVEKRALFSKKIGFTIYKYENNVYYMVKVGLPAGKSHYYCVIDADTQLTVGIIERLQANPMEARAKIYLEDQGRTELMLMVLASETVMNVTSNAEGQIIDPSAGKYISIREEEREFLDKAFIKQNQ